MYIIPIYMYNPIQVPILYVLVGSCLATKVFYRLIAG